MPDLDRAGEEYALLMGKAEFIENVISNIRYAHKIPHRPFTLHEEASLGIKALQERADACRREAFDLVEKAAKDIAKGEDHGKGQTEAIQ